MPIFWKNSVGHATIKEVLSRGFDTGTLGHAYLFTGPAGRGKFPLALEVAQALLCEAEHKPCGDCSACRQVLAHAHPDFRLLFPVALDKSHRHAKTKVILPAGWEYISERVADKLHHPYQITPHYTANTPVDWVRELTAAIQRGSSYTGGYTVVIIEGIDRFSPATANALLKTLEEPPTRTVMILLARSLSSVLPTIQSRCQLFRFGEVSPQDMAPFLMSHVPVADTESVERVIAASIGSPGVALQELTHAQDEGQEILKQYLKVVRHSEDLLAQALAVEQFVEDTLQGDFLLAENLCESLIAFLRGSFLSQFNKAPEYIFPLRAHDLFQHCTPQTLESMVKVIEQARSSSRNHTPLLSIFGTATIQLVELLHE